MVELTLLSTLYQSTIGSVRKQTIGLCYTLFSKHLFYILLSTFITAMFSCTFFFNKPTSYFLLNIVLDFFNIQYSFPFLYLKHLFKYWSWSVPFFYFILQILGYLSNALDLGNNDNSLVSSSVTVWQRILFFFLFSLFFPLKLFRFLLVCFQLRCLYFL